MISWLLLYWIEITGWSIALLSIFFTAVWRYKLWDEKRINRARKAAKAKEELSLQIKELQKDLEAANNRIDKLSDLCQSQIETNKKALAISSYNKGRIDQINKD
jgi:cytochrome c-type biogenesis protein CcmH/NrfG|tara:strand:+ start:520 stop:831 length:312 start_codon:yes stop_codon:yes gene_type:complete